MRIRKRIGSFLTALPLLMTGCGAFARDLSREATPTVVEAGIETVAEEKNKERLEEIAERVKIKAEVTGLDASVPDTTLSRLADSENEPQIKKIVHLLAKAVAEELAKPSPPAIQKSQDENTARSAKVFTKAIMEELRADLPSLIKSVLTDPSVLQSLEPVTRKAASGAVQGAAAGIVGK